MFGLRDSSIRGGLVLCLVSIGIALPNLARADEPSPATAPTDATTPDAASLVDKGQAAKDFVTSVGSAVTTKDGSTFVGSVHKAQDAIEAAGAKRGPPNPLLAGFGFVSIASCNYVLRSSHQVALRYGCYALMPIGVIELALAPFVTEETSEMIGPSAHHVSMSMYALDFHKKSALTGQLRREPKGLGLGYDFGYQYEHPRLGLVGYGHVTWQQTNVDSGKYVHVTNYFAKLDAQVGIDLARLASGGNPSSWFSSQRAYFRAGPSYFHDWIRLDDMGSGQQGLNNPLVITDSAPLVSAFGYELAAEVDIRFPYWLGGLHFNFERGSYPSISFPALDPRQSALVELVAFDDLRAGSSYTWQRIKLELELPIDFSRYGGIFLGGQLASYKSETGSGVDNRGVSLDFRWSAQ